MSKLTPIQQIFHDYAKGKYVQELKESNGNTTATSGLKEAAQAITDLLNEAITETINRYKYPLDAEVADDIATALRTKLGLTTKETN